MRLRHEGKPLLLEKSALAQRLPNASGKLLVHSMGGLVSRVPRCRTSWHDLATQAKKYLFLGTPHHGAPLERIGNWIDTTLLSKRGDPTLRRDRLNP
jgi:triacylglycerol esterase/lipase EstA (alpha/beta hydrolase family)